MASMHMPIANNTEAQMAVFELAVATGIKASRQGAADWTVRDERLAQRAAEQALRAWLLLTEPASRAG
jgi:hypothetical protein